MKFIDAQENLSTQVHPNIAGARKHENQYGKTKMWYIIDTKPGAYRYYGFRKEISKMNLRGENLSKGKSSLRDLQVQ